MILVPACPRCGADRIRAGEAKPGVLCSSCADLGQLQQNGVAPSVSSSAPPLCKTCGHIEARHFADGCAAQVSWSNPATQSGGVGACTCKAFVPPSSSAEPAPPTKKCSECRTSLNDGEGKCFTVCDQCWDKTYRTISGAEKSSPVPVQEEATPAPKNQRIEVSITITGGDGVQRHELSGTIQMQARNAAKKRGLTVDCCTTNDEGL